METNQTSLFNQSGPGRYEPIAYHNTMHLDAALCAKWELMVGSQDATVLGHFMNHPHAAFTPWEVSDATGIFITNIRRSINTLQKKGLLIVSGEKVAKTGHLNNTYKFKQ
jgi:hypothetical protein